MVFPRRQQEEKLEKTKKEKLRCRSTFVARDIDMSFFNWLDAIAERAPPGENLTMALRHLAPRWSPDTASVIANFLKYEEVETRQDVLTVLRVQGGQTIWFRAVNFPVPGIHLAHFENLVRAANMPSSDWRRYEEPHPWPV